MDIRAWHVTGIAAAVCLIGGSAAAVTVCKPAPTVAAPAPAPPGKGVVESIDGVLESIDKGLDSLILDELKPTTTPPPSPRTQKINDALDGLDAAVAPTYSVTAAPGQFPKGTNAAYRRCSVPTGRTTSLSATDAACLINTGSFTAAGAPPPGSYKPGVKVTPAGEVCEKQKPVWFWYGIPLGLLTVVLGWGSLKAARRDGWGDGGTSQFADTDLPEPPPPPTFDPTVAGGGQPTASAPRSGKHTFDSFDDEDF